MASIPARARFTLAGQKNLLAGSDPHNSLAYLHLISRLLMPQNNPQPHVIIVMNYVKLLHVRTGIGTARGGSLARLRIKQKIISRLSWRYQTRHRAGGSQGILVCSAGQAKRGFHRNRPKGLCQNYHPDTIIFMISKKYGGWLSFNKKSIGRYVDNI